MAEEPTTEEVIKNIVELLGVISKNLTLNGNSMENVVTILSNNQLIYESFEKRLKRLEDKNDGHTHWWKI